MEQNETIKEILTSLSNKTAEIQRNTRLKEEQRNILVGYALIEHVKKAYEAGFSAGKEVMITKCN